MPDEVIRQALDIKLLKQFLSKDNSQLNVVYIENLKISGNSEEKQSLLSFVMSLPEPRMENLKRLVSSAVLNHFEGNNSAAARFLGLYRSHPDLKLLISQDSDSKKA